MFTTSTAARDQRAAPRPRRRGAVVRSADRARLERAGWRTTLDFRENHVRSAQGRLMRVESVWVAEAEFVDAAGVDVVCASARTESRAWAKVAAAAVDRVLDDVSRAHDLGVRDLRSIS